MFENEFSTIELYGKIIIGTLKDNLSIDLDAAKIIVRDRIDVVKGDEYALLFDASGVISITKAAREYFASQEASVGINAAAIIVHSPIGMMMGNFFLKINSPEKPTRIFLNREAAFNWLKKYTNSHGNEKTNNV